MNSVPFNLNESLEEPTAADIEATTIGNAAISNSEVADMLDVTSGSDGGEDGQGVRSGSYSFLSAFAVDFAVPKKMLTILRDSNLECSWRQLWGNLEAESTSCFAAESSDYKHSGGNPSRRLHEEWTTFGG